MKFIIFSIVLHFFIFISSYTTIIKAKDFEINEVGNTANSKVVSMDFMNSSNSKKELANNPEKREEKAEKKEKEKEKEKKEIEKVKKTKDEKLKKEDQNYKKREEKNKEKENLEKESKNLEESKNLDKQDSNNSKNPNNNSESFSNSSSNLVELSKGVFAVKNQGVKGLKFQFISNPEPEYPLVAKRLGYSKDVSVKVRFLVGYTGEIEEVKFYGEEDELGFQSEVRATLKKWKLTPITLYDVPVKLYFYKEFKFNKI